MTAMSIHTGVKAGSEALFCSTLRLGCLPDRGFAMTEVFGAAAAILRTGSSGSRVDICMRTVKHERFMICLETGQHVSKRSSS